VEAVRAEREPDEEACEELALVRHVWVMTEAQALDYLLTKVSCRQVMIRLLLCDLDGTLVDAWRTPHCWTCARSAHTPGPGVRWSWSPTRRGRRSLCHETRASGPRRRSIHL